MTNLHLRDSRPALRSHRQTAAVRAAGFAIALAALAPVSRAAAQAPASAPPPPQPVVVQAPARVPPPPVASPPPAGRPAAAAVAVRPAAAVPLRPAPVRVGVPLDSTRAKPAVAAPAPPANAVALCKDGTYIVSPADASACAGHRGLQAAMPQRAAPPSAAARVAVQPAAVRGAASAANTPPPAGATMRCKDGTYLSGAPSGGACAAHAGLAMVMPAPRTPPPAPAHVTSPRRPAPKGGVQAPTAPAPVQPTPARPSAVRLAPVKPKPNPNP